MVLRDRRISISMVSRLVGSNKISLGLHPWQKAQTDQTQELLGVERTATPDQIKKAYRKVRIRDFKPPPASSALY